MCAAKVGHKPLWLGLLCAEGAPASQFLFSPSATLHSANKLFMSHWRKTGLSSLLGTLCSIHSGGDCAQFLSVLKWCQVGPLCPDLCLTGNLLSECYLSKAGVLQLDRTLRTWCALQFNINLPLPWHFMHPCLHCDSGGGWINNFLFWFLRTRHMQVLLTCTLHDSDPGFIDSKLSYFYSSTAVVIYTSLRFARYLTYYAMFPSYLITGNVFSFAFRGNMFQHNQLPLRLQSASVHKPQVCRDHAEPSRSERCWPVALSGQDAEPNLCSISNHHTSGEVFGYFAAPDQACEEMTVYTPEFTSAAGAAIHEIEMSQLSFSDCNSNPSTQIWDICQY